MAVVDVKTKSTCMKGRQRLCWANCLAGFRMAGRNLRAKLFVPLI